MSGIICLACYHRNQTLDKIMEMMHRQMAGQVDGLMDEQMDVCVVVN